MLRRILIADDEVEVREMFAEFFAEQGFEVLEAGNGLEALLHIKRGRPGYVVLDLNMPRLGGIDALKHIRAFDPSIRVVVVTAIADPEVRRQAVARGAAAILSKPVSLAELLGVVTETTPAPEASATATDRAPAAPPLASVMVVDDDRAVRETIGEFLTMHGYAVRLAADGGAALGAIVEHAPDAVLLDIDLPGLRGTEALPIIRGLAPDVAVIMVSGTRDNDTARRALALGAFDYVVKPIDFEYLVRTLETALAMRNLRSDRS